MIEIDSKQKRAWAEVDLDALTANYHTVRGALAPSVRLCCVIKANAYGHGALTLARLYQSLGADFLAVSNIEEALEVRLARVSLPLLILGYTPPACAPLLAEHNLSQCVFSLDFAEELAHYARAAGVTVKIHLKLDTGMGRIGFPVRSEEERRLHLPEIERAATLPGLVREGIFTHFASADEGESGRAFTKEQLAAFLAVTEALARRKICFPLRHAANSAAIFDYPEAALDMVRAGIVLYGLPPSDAVVSCPSLTPALTLRTVVDLVKEIRAGETVSYGRTFRAEKTMRVATFPIGYADGLWRRCGNGLLSVRLRDGFAPLLGRVCMDQCMADVSELPHAAAGDLVTVYGNGGLSVGELAARCGTIAYELLCALGERIPRVYRREGKIVSVFDRILPAYAKGR